MGAGRAAFLLILLLAAGAAADTAGVGPGRPAAAQTLSGPAQVKDGDGLFVQGREIRLYGIDAPESAQACLRDGRKWPAGWLATVMLGLLVAGREVSCIDIGERSYGRIIAICYLGGEDLGAIMVRMGMAYDYARYSGGRYAAAERSARAAGRGVWQGKCEKPWDWRRRNR